MSLRNLGASFMRYIALGLGAIGCLAGFMLLVIFKDYWFSCERQNAYDFSYYLVNSGDVLTASLLSMVEVIFVLVAIFSIGAYLLDLLEKSGKKT
jgi:hypothetical protein